MARQDTCGANNSRPQVTCTQSVVKPSGCLVSSLPAFASLRFNSVSQFFSRPFAYFAGPFVRIPSGSPKTNPHFHHRSSLIFTDVRTGTSSGLFFHSKVHKLSATAFNASRTGFVSSGVSGSGSPGAGRGSCWEMVTKVPPSRGSRL